MTVYLDLILILNVMFDFMLLTTVSIILRRNVRIIKLILGSLIGGLTVLFLFIKLNSIELFLLKILISIIMTIFTFSYKNFKYFINNLFYLYITSIVLGGFMYLLKNEFSYKNNGLIFINNGLSINFIFIIILSPVILIIYIIQCKKLKINYNNYYKVELIYKNKSFLFTGFLDTGNKLKDPYKKRPIILIYTDKINLKYEKSIIVPYKTLNGNGILKCALANKIIIDNKLVIDKPLIGLSNDSFKIDGINLILNTEILEGGKKID